MGKSFLDEDGYLHKKRPQTKQLISLERELVQPEFITDSELIAAKCDICVFDLEIYPNYFLAAFEHVKSGKVAIFELTPNRPVFDVHKLLWVMHNFCVVGFNSMKFDIPIIWLALQGASLEQLNDAVEQIISFDLMPRDIENRFLFKIGQTNHVDLIEVAPLSASLKKYGARLGTQRLQDLPFAPEKRLTSQQMTQVMLYCVNDLALTKQLMFKLEDQLNLRQTMSREYGLDLRSKSDAQIAEAVICSEVAKLNGAWPKKPKFTPGFSFKYQIPDYIQYKTPALQTMLQLVRNATFSVRDSGKVLLPEELIGYEIKIGNSTYRMGNGGLHSSEETIAHVAEHDTYLIDRDVASYYPSMILNQGLYPKHMGPSFLNVYQNIVSRRLAAKKVCNNVVADSLKLTINGSFGKLGSKYSALYSPDLISQVTVSGQLLLLLLIEMIELEGIPVISGNTDGIVIKCPHNKYDMLNAIIHTWEELTGLETEETRYKAVYSRDVNNYIAIYDKPKKGDFYKAKGEYANPGLQKNPTTIICVEAISALILNNAPVEETITACRELTKFVSVRDVKGGGEQNGVYLGKVVRWYYSTETKGKTINYVLSGNKVPKSEGAKPCMDLPPAFPTDIDYEWYVNETVSMLYDIGYYKKPTQQMFF